MWLNEAWGEMYLWWLLPQARARRVPWRVRKGASPAGQRKDTARSDSVKETRSSELLVLVMR